ncbi:MAG TPA: PSD1 and planctomycete cytochrome C domain-containing protein [Pirellulales bacterium]|nr:PSD1 and planctomycete cytochrome C domain-containing protein [Pirellulales bacterium]
MNHRNFLRVAGFVWLAVLSAARPSIAETVVPPVDFNRQIRPILSANCFACHGPDAAERQGNLRLDTKQGALADLGGYVAISPGKPQYSELVWRIISSDPDDVMPPPDSGKKLTPEQIDLIRRWVFEGAKWQEHWSYSKPARPVVPSASAAGGVVNAIDSFVRAKLAEVGLSPSPEADRVTLIRRLSFDLTGLPPTSREVDAFLADQTAQAYEDLVDRLLASPHYGERMAMYWLDVVRFADTNGYHGDNHRDIAMYRDYVIDAFNGDKPFDRFTVEQLAGDLLPNPTRETKVASGYNHLLMTTREGGAQAKEYLAKYAADRVRNASSLWLGATLGCAECHDHKFDPYLTKDFYSFAAFFADIKEVAVGPQEQVLMPDDGQAAKLAQFDAEAAAERKVLETSTPELEAAQVEWENTVRSQLADWKPLKPSGAIAASGATFTIAGDGSMLLGGTTAASDVYTVVAPVKLSTISAVRLEVLPDNSLPGKGSGRAANGNFVLSEIRCTIAPKSNPAAATPLVLREASTDFAQDGLPVTAAIDNNPATGWGIAPQMTKEHVAVFEVQGAPAEEEAVLTFELLQNHGNENNLGRFRISATNSPQPVRANQGLPNDILETLRVAKDARSPEQNRALAAHYRSIAPVLEATRLSLSDLKQAKADFVKTVPTTLVAMSTQPRTMRILPRGNWLSDSGEVVTPGVPAFLPPLAVKDGPATRLDLARWMVAPDNPLVARVFVNRLWKLAFGQGIVKTLDDFGSQGVAPSHPELLDWLAGEFIDSGWDVKHMLKLMAMSATYRQSSAAGESLRQADPYNKWLARQGRFRIDAEMVRDNALAISGLLELKIGGPSVKPYQPRGYWAHLNFPVREYESDHGQSQYRRGLYTYWARTFLHPSLLAFDAPTREECTVERPRSNTPLQALVLLNDPTYVEAARVLARRVLSEGGAETQQRLRWAYRQTLSREPNSDEMAVLGGLLEKHRSEYAAAQTAAQQLISAGEAPVPDNLDRAELAAWTSVVRVLLNLHETITRT